jgi:chromate reductase, NAD(P)H dehydrogenase (quinone)
MRLLVVPGSLREGSFNAAIARAVRGLAPNGVAVEVYDGLRMLPPYDADADGEDVAASVQDLRRRIAAADGVLFVTPEYNGSVPGVLKNAIDWASRPHRECALWGQTVAVAGATTGSYGAVWALADLRRILGIAGARVIDEEVSVSQAHTRVDDDGELADPTTAEHMRQLLAALVEVATPVSITAERSAA